MTNFTRILLGCFLVALSTAVTAQIAITEWMYSGNGAEFVELTNVGSDPIDMSGWSYDDDSDIPGEFDLSAFGTIAPGESVVFSEIDPGLFRADWGLCDGVNVIGPYSNNLGRNDQINIYDAADQLVDRLTYGDVDFPGSIRTQNFSGWVSALGLGADDVFEWTLSSAGDSESSSTSASGDVGSPGRSTRAAVPFDPCAGRIAITEWMYSGSDGEFVELTNVGFSPVDVTGWSYDDDSRTPGEFDLSPFGVIEAGESVVFVEETPADFRSDWALCDDLKVIGPYTNNLGRSDEINIYDDFDQLVDRLTYGDTTFPGSIRTQNASGWVSTAGLGANDVFEWTLSTVGDGEGSYASGSGDIASPGQSTRAGVAFDPCPIDPGAPTIIVEPGIQIGAIGDPTNPGIVLTVSDDLTPIADLIISVSSSDTSVVPDANVTITGTGAERTAVIEPIARGTTTLTFTVTDSDTLSASTNLAYASSAQLPDPSGRYHHQISDASAALEVEDGLMLLVNDETNTLFLHAIETSGNPIQTWTFSAAELGTSDEIDFEGLARSGDRLLIIGSHGNSRTGNERPERRTLIGAGITGSGAGTALSFAGRYNGLWDDLRDWDASNGHGLGADALGFVAGTEVGVEPNPPAGFNIEGIEFAPDGQTLLLGFRAPTIQAVGGEYRALIVPVSNALDLIDGLVAGPGEAVFGDPILLDLDGRSIRALRGNASGEYLLIAGPSPQNARWALYRWSGQPSDAPERLRDLPDTDDLTTGSWEGLASVPAPLEPGAAVRIIADSGDTDFYGTGQTKDLPQPYQKSYSQDFDIPVDGLFGDRFETELR